MIGTSDSEGESFSDICVLFSSFEVKLVLQSAPRPALLSLIVVFAGMLLELQN
jgi:hypothetical protein